MDANAIKCRVQTQSTYLEVCTAMKKIISYSKPI